jgi:hypothetical protein
MPVFDRITASSEQAREPAFNIGCLHQLTDGIEVANQ